MLKNIFYLFLAHFATIKTRLSPKRVVLCYHRLSQSQITPELSPFSNHFVSAKNFENQIKWLLQIGKIVSLDSLLKNAHIVPKRWEFSLTFDDGNKDVIEFGLEILRKYNAPATMFINSYYVDNSQDTPWQDIIQYILGNLNHEVEIKIGTKVLKYSLSYKKEQIRFATDIYHYLTHLPYDNFHHLRRQLYDLTEGRAPNTIVGSEDIRLASETGLFTFGGHSSTHPNLALCSEENLDFEIVEDKKRLEHITRNHVSWFAYPYGKRKYITERVVQYVKKANYSAAFTIHNGYLMKNKNPFFLDRIPINGNWNMYQFKGRISGADIYNLLKVEERQKHVIIKDPVGS